MRRMLAGCATAMLLVTGCAAGPQESSSAGGATLTSPSASSRESSRVEPTGVPADVVGWTYESTLVNGFTLQPGTVVQISFAADGMMSAQAGCNYLGGQVSVQSGKLSSAPMSMTVMACEAGLAAQDQWLSGLLTSRPTFVVTGTKLIVADGSTSISLERKRFNAPMSTPTTPGVPKPIPPVPLGEFTSSHTRVSRLPTDVPVHMTFTTDTVSVRAACNTIKFHIELDEASITAPAVSSTDQRCDGDRSAADQALAKFFQGPVDFKFDGADIVVLINGPGQIVLDRIITSGMSSPVTSPTRTPADPTG